MLWYSGSSTEGLPFIHDSFRANPKAVHHKPKQRRQPDSDEKSSSNHIGSHGDTARSIDGGDSGVAGTAVPSLNGRVHRDIGSEATEHTERLKLPAVITCMDTGVGTSGQLSSRTDNGHSKDPSFNGYIRRYKACARLKGISPTRAYCSTRAKTGEGAQTKDVNHDTDHHGNHQNGGTVSPNKDPTASASSPISPVPSKSRYVDHEVDSNSPMNEESRNEDSKSAKVTFGLDSSPSAQSNTIELSTTPGTLVAAASSAMSAAASTGTSDRLPKINMKENSLTTNGSMNGFASSASSSHRQSELEQRIEEKLKRGGSVGDGMRTPGVNTSGKKGGKGSKGGEGRGGKDGVHRGNSYGGGRIGGGRPLGDIVTSRRLQELLDHENDRTLPYTYYRTAVGKDEPHIERAQFNSPQ